MSDFYEFREIAPGILTVDAAAGEGENVPPHFRDLARIVGINTPHPMIVVPRGVSLDECRRILEMVEDRIEAMKGGNLGN